MCKTSQCVWSMEHCEGCDVCVRQVSVCGVRSIGKGMMCVCKTSPGVWSMEYCEGCDV